MKLFILLLFFPVLALASNNTIYHGYEDYFATLPGRLFQGKEITLDTYHAIEEDNESCTVISSYFETDDGHERQDKVLDVVFENCKKGFNEEEAYYYGRNEVIDGRERQIVVSYVMINIDGHVLKRKSIKVFKGEKISGDDFSDFASVYFTKNWTCVESRNRSAFNIFPRYQTVYLINQQKDHKLQGWVLPSLFASCAMVRMKSGQIKFDRIEYRFQKGRDEAVGVSFSEYTIQGGKFVRTNRPRRNATFVEPDNVYQFKFDK